MGQEVLVTGATGFIGIEVSRQLAEQGMRPRLMVRRPVRGLMLRSLDADIMQADIRSPRSLRRRMSGVDTVIHLGARAAFEAYSKLYRSIVAGSLNLMQTAIAAGVSTFVYGGSLMVYNTFIPAYGLSTCRRESLSWGRSFWTFISV
jgi:dihydroflavonol-4-reductase